MIEKRKLEKKSSEYFWFLIQLDTSDCVICLTYQALAGFNACSYFSIRHSVSPLFSLRHQSLSSFELCDSSSGTNYYVAYWLILTPLSSAYANLYAMLNGILKTNLDTVAPPKNGFQTFSIRLSARICLSEFICFSMPR